MFGRTDNKNNPPKTPTSKKSVTSPSVIAEDMNVLGNIVSEGVLDIDGKIEGNVRCQSASIRENGKIRGDVMADTVHVYGSVEGLIKARTVILYASARVAGTIMHESLSIEDGAFVDGKFKRTDKVFIDDEEDAPKRLTSPTISARDAEFSNDNEEPVSDAEKAVLENLRLIR